MRHSTRSAAALILLVASLAWTAFPRHARAQTPDDPFFDWDLERYRISRVPGDPSGGMLPLPAPAGAVEGPGIIALSVSGAAAGITQPHVPLEESDGLNLPDGARVRVEIEGMIPLPLLNLRAQIAGRYLLDHDQRPTGGWLDRSIYWIDSRTEIRAGRCRSFWGDASEGSLLLGRNAPPLEMIRVRSVRPWQLPGLGGRAAGRIQASAFLAYLNDGARVIPDPLLHGERLEWEPTGFARLSLSRTILLGGAGRTQRLTLRDIGNILLARNENTKDPTLISNSDQKASMGIELRLPPDVATAHTRGLLEGGRFFYEYAGEDGPHPIIPRAPAHAFGFTVALHGWVALMEFADTMNRANHWYTHWIYGPQAYFYKGFCLGHPMGTLGWSRHVRVWTPPWERVRAQAWLRVRGHTEADPSGGALPDTPRREDSIGFGLRHDFFTGEILDAQFEGYREAGSAVPRPKAPVRWRASIGIRIGASGPPIGAQE